MSAYVPCPNPSCYGGEVPTGRYFRDNNEYEETTCPTCRGMIDIPAEEAERFREWDRDAEVTW